MVARLNLTKNIARQNLISHHECTAHSTENRRHRLLFRYQTTRKSFVMTKTKTTPLVALATLWLNNSLAEAAGGGRGPWGSSILTDGYHRRGYGGLNHNRVVHENYDGPVAELVRDLFYAPAYSNSLMRQQQGSVFVGNDDESGDSSPRLDISEHKDGTTEILMEVPGLSARDLNIELENDHILRVEGIRTKRKDGYVSETIFSKQIRLKDTMDVDNLKANLSSGLLTITLPRKPTKIKKFPILTDEPRSILDPVNENSKNDGNEGETP